jgi:hypothetical protein
MRNRLMKRENGCEKEYEHKRSGIPTKICKDQDTVCGDLERAPHDVPWPYVVERMLWRYPPKQHPRNIDVVVRDVPISPCRRLRQPLDDLDEYHRF